MPSKVTKWLNLFKPSSPEAIDELVQWMYPNVKLLDDIEETLEKLSSPLASDVCQRLYIFYKANSDSLRHFTIFLLPSLIQAYLTHLGDDEIAPTGRKISAIPSESQTSNIANNLTSLESCLVGISRHYLLLNPKSIQCNLSSADPNTFIPAFMEPSIFHDPLPLPDAQPRDPDTFPSITLPAIRFNISALTCLTQDYLDTLSSVDLLDPMNTLLSLHSMNHYCLMCTRIASLSQQPRIPASPSLLSHLLVGLDTILFKLDSVDKRTDTIRRTSLSIRTAVWDAVKDIEKRATFACSSGPLIICRAMLHGRAAQYGQRAVPGMRLNTGSSAFVDIGLLLTSADERTTLNGPVSPATTENLRSLRPRPSTTHEVITNASFRPEALPEDIPINNRPQKPKYSTLDQNTNASKSKPNDSSMNGKPNTLDSRHRTGAHKHSQKSDVTFIAPSALKHSSSD